MVKSWILIFCMYFSKDGDPTILCLISATAEKMMKSLAFVSIHEKQVIDKLCLNGLSD